MVKEKRTQVNRQVIKGDDGGCCDYFDFFELQTLEY